MARPYEPELCPWTLKLCGHRQHQAPESCVSGLRSWLGPVHRAPPRLEGWTHGQSLPAPVNVCEMQNSSPATPSVKRKALCKGAPAVVGGGRGVGV